jgi:glycosyltransferase involved in cell wall biosynthesis
VDTPVFSIVTICKNARTTLERTIQSVLEQDGPGFEYILIDGGSTDGTVDLLRKWDARITYWVSEPDEGISAAFNKGLLRCRGEWVGTINADDWYQPGALEAVASMPQTVEIACGHMRYWDHGRPVTVFSADPGRLRQEMTINHQATFVRRRVYERLGGFREDFRYAMDYELFLRFSLGGARFAEVDRVLANMRYRGVSHRHWLRAYAEVRRAQVEHGLGASRAWRLWFFHITRGFVRSLLLRLGLDAVVRFYRRHFAVRRKSS